MREPTNEDSGVLIWFQDEGQNGVSIAKFRCIVEDVGEPRKYKDEDGLIWDHAWVPETQEEIMKFRICLLEDRVGELENRYNGLIERLKGAVG